MKGKISFTQKFSVTQNSQTIKNSIFFFKVGQQAIDQSANRAAGNRFSVLPINPHSLLQSGPLNRKQPFLSGCCPVDGAVTSRDRKAEWGWGGQDSEVCCKPISAKLQQKEETPL